MQRKELLFTRLLPSEQVLDSALSLRFSYRQYLSSNKSRSACRERSRAATTSPKIASEPSAGPLPAHFVQRRFPASFAAPISSLASTSRSLARFWRPRSAKLVTLLPVPSPRSLPRRSPRTAPLTSAAPTPNCTTGTSTRRRSLASVP